MLLIHLHQLLRIVIIIPNITIYISSLLGLLDIKCENIMVTSWNWIYVTDFASYKPTLIPEVHTLDIHPLPVISNIPSNLL